MKYFLVVLTLIATSIVLADTVTIPNTLSNGSVADADDVNANFAALAAESNENDARIGLLEGGKFVTPNISLSNNDAGTHNTIFGSSAGANLDSISVSNSAFGRWSLNANTTGSYNSAFGSSSLGLNTEGRDNSAFGDASLARNITGDANTAMGYAALYYNTAGLHNTSVGFQALMDNTTGWLNTASGSGALNSNTTGDANTAFGTNALASNTTGANNTAIGSLADVTSDILFNATAIGYNAKVDASNKVRIGNSSVTAIDVQVALAITSDRRLKEDIQTTSLGLDFVNDLNPVQYHRINNQGDDIELGIIAQELQSALEKHNASNLGTVQQVGDSSMSVRYNDLFAPLIKSVQELSAENALLKDEVSEIVSLRAELAELKALVLARSIRIEGL